MVEEKGLNETTEATSASFSLRRTIRSSREFLDRLITTARVHSPFAEDKLEAADATVEGVIHKGYQGLKSIAVNGHPVVILSVAGIAGAAPSIPFGLRATVRNAGLALALASVMIYPDHLRRYAAGPSAKSSNE